MNLITAALVEGAFTSAQKDREMRKRDVRRKSVELVPQIKRVFGILDKNGSGSVDMSEVFKLSAKDLPRDLQDVISFDSLTDLFLMLDIDNSGSIDQDEFVDGVLT